MDSSKLLDYQIHGSEIGALECVEGDRIIGLFIVILHDLCAGDYTGATMNISRPVCLLQNPSNTCSVYVFVNRRAITRTPSASNPFSPNLQT